MALEAAERGARLGGGRLGCYRQQSVFELREVVPVVLAVVVVLDEVQPLRIAAAR